MNLRAYEMTVQGMTCHDCEIRVATALEQAGAKNIQVDHIHGRATFLADPSVDPVQFKRAVDRAGYTGGHPKPERPPSAGSSGPGPYDADLLVIGSGAAAFAAAIRATELGAKVIMVERGTVGGTCVNVGCIPSKALLKGAEDLYTSQKIGLNIDPSGLVPRIVGQKDALVAALRERKYIDLIEAYGWELIPGTARFIDQQHVEVGNRRFKAKAYLIATGASPWIPPIPGIEKVDYLTSTSALNVLVPPRSLAVIGGNAIGLELGQYFARVGSKVTVFEMMPRIAPFEEPELSTAMHDALVNEGIEIVTGAEILEISNGTIRVAINGREASWQADSVLVATGRRPNTAELGLERAGIATDPRGAIKVDATLRTTNPSVWAAGDVTGGPQFVYVAAYQGKLAAENILLGKETPVDLSIVPRVTFTMPQIASVGMSEAQAGDAGLDVGVSLLPLDQVPRALVNGYTHGIVKLVFDSATGRLLGCHIVAENAGEVIYAAALGMRFGITLSDLADSFAPYLTMAESLKLAAQGVHRDVSKLSCCAG